MTARLLSVSSSDWPASETKLRSFRMSETVRSAISMDLSGLSTKTLSTSPHCSSKRPRLSSESGSTCRSTRPRRSLSSRSASSSEPLSSAVRSYSEPNSSLLRSRCSSLLCAALRREAKNSASNKTTTTTMITIKVVVLTFPPPARFSLSHCSPQRNPRNVAVCSASRTAFQHFSHSACQLVVFARSRMREYTPIVRPLRRGRGVRRVVVAWIGGGTSYAKRFGRRTHDRARTTHGLRRGGGQRARRTRRGRGTGQARQGRLERGRRERREHGRRQE